MGLLDRIKGALSAKASAAIDRAIDPARELELTIAELDAGRVAALKELVSYKANAKLLEQDIAARGERARLLEQRAMQAVKAGDDALARRCLREKQEAEAELGRVTRDRDELASHAIKLNASRKQLEAKLALLKMRKGTLAGQLAVARSGKDPLRDQTLFDRLDAAGVAIDDDAARAEAAAELGLEDAPPSTSAAGARSAGEPLALPGDDLDALKARMAADGATPRKK